MYAKKNNSAKLVVLVLVLALLIGGVVGGTIAWLVTNTAPVVNTFTVGNINITLTETGTTEDKPTFKMVPGTEIGKDPVVTIQEGSEKCWVFVKVEEAGSVTVGTEEYGFDAFVNYGVRDTWEEVEAADDGSYVVYGYKTVVDATNDDQELYVLTAGTAVDANEKLKNPNGCVTIPQSVTKAMMEAVASGTAPKLTFTAYAIQSENLTKTDGTTTTAVTTAAEAWEVYQNPPEAPQNP